MKHPERVEDYLEHLARPSSEQAAAFSLKDQRRLEQQNYGRFQ
jgi:hypothetical protein